MCLTISSGKAIFFLPAKFNYSVILKVALVSKYDNFNLGFSCCEERRKKSLKPSKPCFLIEVISRCGVQFYTNVIWCTGAWRYLVWCREGLPWCTSAGWQARRPKSYKVLENIHGSPRGHVLLQLFNAHATSALHIRPYWCRPTGGGAGGQITESKAKAWPLAGCQLPQYFSHIQPRTAYHLFVFESSCVLSAFFLRCIRGKNKCIFEWNVIKSANPSHKPLVKIVACKLWFEKHQE